ncbi:Luciferase-like monooxygenase [Roseomonas mucosa]|uniref:Luciferase-like monooxygenase n=1 Tax=Roseomonas mucosa TaxID=207340 RepID=A0A379N450_9PROT|nr:MULTISPECIES: LLM class flavin-dependent oxidoreductase [Roseomonas]MBS5901497.1 LLM class flavin-dependent oxidoreductase [Acetobacteraceae bacterium]MCG7352431.1 LLM class flavin-dependent oxidoreductase [Roseomonas mucosa]MCG7357818.1 LLM class flavin-dependent oxidoreductase [Roseomonas mucosa]MDT8288909.1 LLM class flavin-dependent oxidoreductase [Roseomonas mucosa]MDT8294476.1 LLM class flavin-dependent oxidoreductase [Roseomonas mucosa]
MVPFTLLDLSPIPQGADAGTALRNTIDLARHAEAWGYRRFWLAEHHNMPGIASAATAVVIGQVAAATSRIRVGAAGIMLPNHAPLVIAEQFGTLAALFPGRVDLGLGRAPGSDMRAARALRRNLDSDPDGFPRDVVELQSYFRPARPGQPLQAVPGAGQDVPLWILGSSLYGAQLAAALGLPYAFASHFAPDALDEALRVYREQFRPSEQLDRPHVAAAINVFADETEAGARRLFTSLQQQFLNLRRGTPGQLPPPVDSMDRLWTAAERAGTERALSCSAVGTPAQVRAGLEAFLERTGADELVLTGQIFDHEARLRSFRLVAELGKDLLPRHGG